MGHENGSSQLAHGLSAIVDGQAMCLRANGV
jgi:hypothetical protein